MVADLFYSTVTRVTDSWELLRKMPRYQEKTGIAVFKKLFELEPTAKAVFGFKASADVEKELYESPTFSRHAIILIQMFDYAFSMLGPDIDLWSEMMLDLGEKHVAYGVQLEHYRGMGQALVYALREQLGGRFTKEIKEAWVEVYGALSSDMIRAQKSFC